MEHFPQCTFIMNEKEMPFPECYFPVEQYDLFLHQVTKIIKTCSGIIYNNTVLFSLYEHGREKVTSHDMLVQLNTEIFPHMIQDPRINEVTIYTNPIGNAWKMRIRYNSYTSTFSVFYFTERDETPYIYSYTFYVPVTILNEETDRTIGYKKINSDLREKINLFIQELEDDEFVKDHHATISFVANEKYLGFIFSLLSQYKVDAIQEMILHEFEDYGGLGMFNDMEIFPYSFEFLYNHIIRI